MKTSSSFKYLPQALIAILLAGFMTMFYFANGDRINHESEMFFASKAERSMIAEQAYNFKFISMSFGEETTRMNYLKIMGDHHISPEAKRVIRLAYMEHFKE